MIQIFLRSTTVCAVHICFQAASVAVSAGSGDSACDPVRRFNCLFVTRRKLKSQHWSFCTTNAMEKQSSTFAPTLISRFCHDFWTTRLIGHEPAETEHFKFKEWMINSGLHARKALNQKCLSIERFYLATAGNHQKQLKFCHLPDSIPCSWHILIVHTKLFTIRVHTVLCTFNFWTETTESVDLGQHD